VGYIGTASGMASGLIAKKWLADMLGIIFESLGVVGMKVYRDRGVGIARTVVTATVQIRCQSPHEW